MFLYHHDPQDDEVYKLVRNENVFKADVESTSFTSVNASSNNGTSNTIKETRLFMLDDLCQIYLSLISEIRAVELVTYPNEQGKNSNLDYSTTAVFTRDKIDFDKAIADDGFSDAVQSYKDSMSLDEVRAKVSSLQDQLYAYKDLVTTLEAERNS